MKRELSVCWSARAERDLDSIEAFCGERDPFAAVHLLDAIDRSLSLPAAFPEMSRIGRFMGTREHVVPGTPFVPVHLLPGERIEVVRVLHGRRQWPPPDDAPIV